jgi:predicted dehydrogenase
LFTKEDGAQPGAANKTEIVLPAVDQFASEMDHFSDCVIAGKDPRTPGELGLADMRIIEALHEAIRTGGSVAVAR